MVISAYRTALLISTTLAMSGICAFAAKPVEPVSSADLAADAAMQGDYQGTRKDASGKESPFVAQVLALGNGEFRVNLLGEFDKRVAPVAVLTGKREADKVVLANADGWTAAIQGEKLAGGSKDGTFEMKRIVRVSPTMGAKMPAGGTMLLGADTKDLGETWSRAPKGDCKWKLLEGGVMQCVPGSGSIVTKKEFGDCFLHVEFREPFEPAKRGQGRGNSGVYLQSRYEVQVLDSYALPGKDDDCGGIYKIALPIANMSYPPLQWQTYDITFHAAQMKDGKVAKFARITVLHNGVKIHDNVELPHTTTASMINKIGTEGPLYLQDHGHSVEYRNIWLCPVDMAPGDKK